MRRVVLLTAMMLAARVAAAQDFVPPKNTGHSGTRIGMFGFGVRGGVDLRSDGQFILGATLDIGDLFTSRVRMRPAFDG